MLNDVWEFDLTTNNWRWLKGSNQTNVFGVYGTQGVALENGGPGGRREAGAWQVGNKVYLFGGEGKAASTSGVLNDLWEFDLNTNNWRWLKGSDLADQEGLTAP